MSIVSSVAVGLWNYLPQWLICFEATLLFQVISLYRIFTLQVFSRLQSLFSELKPPITGLFRSVLFDLVRLLYAMGTHNSSRNISQIMGTIKRFFLYIFMGTIIRVICYTINRLGR